MGKLNKIMPSLEGCTLNSEFRKGLAPFPYFYSAESRIFGMSQKMDKLLNDHVQRIVY